MDLQGKVCLITGASSGIGAALARDLVAAGAKVTLFARRAEKLESVAAALGPDTLVAPGDVTNADDLRRAVQATVDRFGGLDVLVNNAGVGLIGRIAKLPAADVEQVWRVNVLGVILAVQAALPALRERAGLIVNMSSETSVNANPGLAGYASTKAALNQLTNTLRKELEPEGVRVMNIFPGFLKNEFGENAIYAEDDIDMARLVRFARTSRTSDDASRDIVRAIQQDLDDWRYVPPPRA